MTTGCELAARTRIRAFRAYQYVLIVAEGELPTPGFEVNITQSLIKIHPPQYNLLRCPGPGVFPQVVTPFRYCETIRFPEDQPTVTIHHAEGTDAVDIEACGKELSGYVDAVKGDRERACPAGADDATGFSGNLSFDEAFRNAMSNLPPIENPHPDMLERVQVVEIGGLFGGFAGFHDLVVRVCRTHD